MTDKLSLYNRALFHCQARRLADLTEEVEPRHHLDQHYPDVLKYMIEQGYWKFALRSVHITKDPAITPAFGYSCAFNHPDDFVKTYQLSTSDRFDPPLWDWIDESNLFWCDQEEIYLRYVSNSSSGYGYDLARWTGKFEEAFVRELAFRVAPRLPGSKADLEALLTLKDDMLAEALTFEAMKEPSKRPPMGRWATNRFRGSSRRPDYRA